MKDVTKAFLKQWKVTLGFLGLVLILALGTSLAQGVPTAYAMATSNLSGLTFALAALLVTGLTLDLILQKDKIVLALKVVGGLLVFGSIVFAFYVNFPSAKEFFSNYITLPLAMGFGCLLSFVVAGYFVRKYWAVLKPWFSSDRGKTISFTVLVCIGLITTTALFAFGVIGWNEILIGAIALMFLIPLVNFNAKIRTALASRAAGVIASFLGIAGLFYVLTLRGFLTQQTAEIIFGSFLGSCFLGWLIWRYRKGIADKWGSAVASVKAKPKLNWKTIFGWLFRVALVAGGGVGIYYLYEYGYLASLWLVALVSVGCLLAVWLFPKIFRWLKDKWATTSFRDTAKTKWTAATDYAKNLPRPSVGKIAKVLFWLILLAGCEYGVYFLYGRQSVTFWLAVVLAVSVPIVLFLLRKIGKWAWAKRKKTSFEKLKTQVSDWLKKKKEANRTKFGWFILTVVFFVLFVFCGAVWQNFVSVRVLLGESHSWFNPVQKFVGYLWFPFLMGFFGCLAKTLLPNLGVKKRTGLTIVGALKLGIVIILICIWAGFVISGLGAG